MEMFSDMTPAPDTPVNPPAPDPSPASREVSSKAGEPRDEPLDLEDADYPPGEEAIPPESDLGDLPDEGLTAEERLLDSIVSDLPGKIRQMEDELQSVRDDLARTAADRDDLGARLDLAAVEFDRLNREIDASDVEIGKVRAALKAAQDALAAAEGAAAAALREREAAVGKLEEFSAASQREMDHLRTTLRQRDLEAESTTQRRWRFVPAGAIAIALLAAGGGYALGRAGQTPSSVAPDVSVALPAPPLPVVAAPVRAVPADRVRTAKVMVTPPAWPLIRDPRLTVRQEPAVLAICFNDPVFARAAEIQPAGRQDLRRLAALLKPHLAAYRVEVEGHTDSAPVASRVSYTSNHELGLIRARAAMEVLAKEGGLPLSSLSISSAGDTHPPFPGDSMEARRRCRTVVVKLHRVKPPAP
jgi:flagellar motor protein MotB